MTCQILCVVDAHRADGMMIPSAPCPPHQYIHIYIYTYPNCPRVDLVFRFLVLVLPTTATTATTEAGSSTKDVADGSAMAGGGKVTMGSMAEARVRFLTAVKAHYTARYHQGWLSSMGLRVLKVKIRGGLRVPLFERITRCSFRFTSESESTSTPPPDAVRFSFSLYQ